MRGTSTFLSKNSLQTDLVRTYFKSTSFKHKYTKKIVLFNWVKTEEVNQSEKGKPIKIFSSDTFILELLFLTLDLAKFQFDDSKFHSRAVN